MSKGWREEIERFRSLEPTRDLWPDITRRTPRLEREPQPSMMRRGIIIAVASLLVAVGVGLPLKALWPLSGKHRVVRPVGSTASIFMPTIPGFGNVLFADNTGKTWYDAATLKIDRAYRSGEKFGWGGGIAYTLAKRQTEGFNDDFSFPSRVDYPKQVRNDERHRLVANWVIGMPAVLDLQFSGVATIGSGVNYDVGDRFGGTSNPLIPGGFDAPTYKNVDLRLRKDFRFGQSYRLGLTIDGFNVFNTQNLGGYNTFNPSDANFGKAGVTLSDPRRVQFGLEVGF